METTRPADGDPAEGDPGDVPPAKSAVRRFLPIAVVAAGLAAGYAAGLHEYLTLSFFADARMALRDEVAARPVLAGAAFVGFYVLATAFAFPAASVLTIFGGFLFGWLAGGALSIAGATLGATILFLAARSAVGDTLRRKAGGIAARLARGFEEDAFVYLLVLRIAPFFPFFLVNIAPALFKVRTRTFMAATALGIVPGGFAYAWLGQGVDSVLTAAEASGADVSVGDLVTPEITIAFGALALVALLAAVVKRLWSRRQRKPPLATG